MSIPVRPAAAATVLVGGLLLAGCGASAPPADPPAPVSTVPPVSIGPPPTTSASPTPTAPPTATDGRNYAACRDGRCVVEVTTGTSIRFDPGLRISRFRVASVANGEVTIETAFPSGGSGTTTTGAGGTGTVNGVSFQVLDVRGDTAVLALTPS